MELLDESNFIEQLMIGEPIWTGHPNPQYVFSYWSIVKDTAVIVIMGGMFAILLINILDGVPSAGIFQLGSIVIGSFLIIFMLVKGFHYRRLVDHKNSNYVFSSSHIAQVHQSGKVLYKKPLTQVYQIIIEHKKRGYGHVHMMIKDNKPSKKKVISISRKMPYPSLSLKGIKDFEKVAQTLVNYRNEAIAALED